MSELNKIVTNFPMSLSQDENRNLALTLSAVLEFDQSTMSGYGTEAAPYGVDTTVIATRDWVEEQGYLTSVPDSYATKEYANDTSANALSQAQSWVESQDFLTQAYLANYATQTWVNLQGFLTEVPSTYVTDSELTATVSGLATKSEVTSGLSAKQKTLSDITDVLVVSALPSSAAIVSTVLYLIPED